MIRSAFLRGLLAIALGFLISLSITGCSSSPTQESTGQFVDDSTITTKIKAKLLDDPLVSGLAISVETYKGVVQLSGFANTNDERKQAVVIAQQTDGVRSVKNDIHLK